MLDRRVFAPVRAVVMNSPEYQRYLAWLVLCEEAYSRDETMFFEIYNNPASQEEARGVQELARVLVQCYQGFIETANQSYMLSEHSDPFCERCRYERAVSVFCGHVGEGMCTINSVLCELSQEERRRVCHLTLAITQMQAHWWQLIATEHTVQMLRPFWQCNSHDIMNGCM
jgi:hypothetical protein